MTDIAFRDVHQSLLATRVRVQDSKAIAGLTDAALPELFLSKIWGGATFGVAYRSLTEDPWQRLRKIRQLIPDTLLQMLFRGSNAVGYQDYPDNVIEEFTKESARRGVDVSRISDSLNQIPQMERSIQVVWDTGKIAEAAICYTGDINDSARAKYNVQYHLDMAKGLENLDAQIITIKDMASLLKPQAAYRLISELRAIMDLSIHLHTRDTSGNGIITYSAVTEAGVDIVDVTMSAMSGATNQPSMNSLYCALVNGERTPTVDIDSAQKISHYWGDTRMYYQPFGNGLSAPQTEVYTYGMSDGQYSDLQQQAKAVDLGHRWDEIKEIYHTANLMFGDIVKVTPSSKVVGDMALFTVQNNLTEQDVYARGEELSFPESVMTFFQGDLDQLVGGFPKELQRIVLKGRLAFAERPGDLAAPVDFTRVQEELAEKIGYQPKLEEVLSHLTYPQIFLEYRQKYEIFGDITLLDTLTFFNSIRQGEALEVQTERGKTLIIRLDEIGEPNIDGNRVLFFNSNGQCRKVLVKGTSIKFAVQVKQKAEPTNEEQIGATISGSVLQALVRRGNKVEGGQPLLIIEAMKIETAIGARFAGTVDHIYVEEDEVISSGGLLLEVEEE